MAPALASDDSDDEDRDRDGKHKRECKIQMVEVDGETLIITGWNLTK